MCMEQTRWHNASAQTEPQNFVPAMLKMHYVLKGPIEADTDKSKALIDANGLITIRDIAVSLNLSNLSVHDHVTRLDLFSKLEMFDRMYNHIHRIL